MKEALAKALGQSLERVLGGASADLQEFGAVIANDMVAALAAGDTELRGEIVDQAKMVAEVHRLSVESEGWALMRGVLSGVFAAAAAGLAATLDDLVEQPKPKPRKKKEPTE